MRGSLLSCAPASASLCVVAWLLLPGGAEAQPQTVAPDFRLQVFVDGPEAQALYARIEGQLSDLPVQHVAEAVPHAAMDVRAGQAQQRVAAGEADAVVWFGERPRRRLVFVSAAAHRPLLIARLPAGPDGVVGSSDRELAALVVRGAVLALAEGQLPAEVVPGPDEGVAMRPPAAEPQEAFVAPQEDAAPAAASAQASALTLRAALGLQQWFDGSGGAGRTGARLGCIAQLSHLRLGAAGALSWPKSHTDDFGQVRIARNDITVSASLWRPLGDGAGFAGLHAGAALFSRTTHADSTQLAGRAARTTPAGLTGAHAGYAAPLGPVDVVALAALDAMPSPPRFEYAVVDAPAAPVYAAPIWSLRVSLGIEARVL